MTRFEHRVDDFKKEIYANDTTHFQEVIELHELEKDSTVINYNDHYERKMANFKRRIIHPHLFDKAFVVKILDFVGFKIVDLGPFKPYHIFVIAQKRDRAESIDISFFLDKSGELYTQSPFPTD